MPKGKQLQAGIREGWHPLSKDSFPTTFSCNVETHLYYPWWNGVWIYTDEGASSQASLHGAQALYP